MESIELSGGSVGLYALGGRGRRLEPHGEVSPARGHVLSSGSSFARIGARADSLPVPEEPVKNVITLRCLVLVAVLCAGPVLALAKPGMSFADLMQVRKVFGTVLSEDGGWVALEARPDRGDGEVIARSTQGRAEHRIPRGQSPVLTPDGAWVAARVLAPFAEREQAEAADMPDPGSVLLRTRDGKTWGHERVESFAFSDDGGWFAVHFLAEKDSAETQPESGALESTPESEQHTNDETEPREPGTRLLLMRLSDQREFEFENVKRWAFDPTSKWLALAVATREGADNRLEIHALGDDPTGTAISAAARVAFPALQWAEEQAILAFLQADETEPGKFLDATLHVVDFRGPESPGPRTIVSAQEGWEFPAENELKFSRDGARLFVGLRPAPTEEPEEPEESMQDDFDPFDHETILRERGVDVWHWQDPRIKTHEKASWKDRQKHLYRAVVHLDTGTMVPLAAEDLPRADFTENESVTLGRTDLPHLPLQTWDGFYEDVHIVDLHSGARTLVVGKTKDDVALSPRGGFVAYYRPEQNGQWWVYDVARAEHRQLVAPVPFADQDHDYPSTPPGYGIGGFTRDDRHLLVNDQYDVWRFDTATGRGVCLTAGRGRADQRTYRVRDLDPELEGIEPGSTLLLDGFDERRKTSSFWSVALDGSELRELRAADKRFRFVGKAEQADVVVYTEERYDEFPDLWVADPGFRRARKLTDLNPQLRDFDLGRAELVEWSSTDGVPLRGVLIKPAGHDPKKRYPVFVYFYRFFSQRLHEFNDPVVNHRPSFPVYAGDGYAVFLPDIRFEIGEPGSSATRCLVPGVQKLVEMGIADPDAIALHGHSWSGYQAAHVITQTDLFACAVAGAPVSNMVSAYGGIRYGTGLARLFQYEKEQSRIGASLWERRDLYIENSPVFFADRIRTPLLIQFGDVDEAVPWTQGIELYLAMRRLGKPAVMLQYRDEPHHLKKYANKLDYSIRMKEFVDHFCKGAPAPAWWSEGEPYTGN